jgi:hypothetical protein
MTFPEENPVVRKIVVFLRIFSKQFSRHFGFNIKVIVGSSMTNTLMGCKAIYRALDGFFPSEKHFYLFHIVAARGMIPTYRAPLND